MIDLEGVYLIPAQDMKSMDIKVFRGDAVVIATGGMGMVFGKSTNSTINNEYAAARLYEQGAIFSNAEFVHNVQFYLQIIKNKINY